MPRKKRVFIARDFGSHHIVSSVAGGSFLFGDIEKERLLGMLEQYSQAFFVHLHGFAIMSNHLHIIVTEGTKGAAAPPEELLRAWH
jgi:REP element-mobilizing transposase RayT